jgi:hypothetical protein
MVSFYFPLTLTLPEGERELGWVFSAFSASSAVKVFLTLL